MWGFVTSSLFLVIFAAGVNCIEVIWPNYEIEPEIYKCLKEGRFAHPFNCGNYVECIRHSEGFFKRRFGSCHGGIFSQKTKSCTFDQDEESICKTPSRVARSLRTVNEAFSSICQSTNGFVCADCKTVVNCVDGVPYPSTCGTGDFCAEKPAFGGAVCYPPAVDKCNCSYTNEFHIDSYNPRAFYFCGENGMEPELINNCPDGMEFDEDFSQCINIDGMPHCNEPGVLPNYQNCSQYYTCIASRSGWVQQSFDCDANLMYNEDSGACEDPCSWDDGRFTCLEEGRFSDPLSCEHYYECYLEGAGFRQERQQCPSGNNWNGVGCTKASEYPCTPVKVSKCFIPDGRCPDVSPGVVRGTGEAPVRRFTNPMPYNAPSQYQQLWQQIPNRGVRRS